MIELQERLYTSTEVAEILGVSLRSVYRYLEENKLSAEVKTATGRHRFTKKNILDFLYPDGESASRNLEEKQPRTTPVVEQVEVTQVEVTVEPAVEEPMVEELQPQEKQPAVESPKVETAEEEEQVDWLAKFREAAKKFKEEEGALENQVASSDTADVNVKAPQEELISGLNAQEPVQEIEDIKEHAPIQNIYYYKSGLGGLKDIAQNVDKNARGSGVEYAFTLNAGLSLFKPIRPFSMLHVYIKPEDRDYYERVLKLVPSKEEDSQLCLVLSKQDMIFDQKSEVHGLYVVAKEQLVRDIKEMGDSTLLNEAQSILL